MISSYNSFLLLYGNKRDHLQISEFEGSCGQLIALCVWALIGHCEIMSSVAKFFEGISLSRRTKSGEATSAVRKHQTLMQKISQSKVLRASDCHVLAPVNQLLNLFVLGGNTNKQNSF